jgi:putative tricarboxylic transport membrane protein
VTKEERIIALVILLVGAVYLATALSMPSMSIGDPLGHKAFPIILGGLMILLGLALLFKPEKQSGPALSMRNIVTILVLTGLLACYGWTLDWTGYPLGTFLFLVVTVRLLGERKWSLNLSLSAALSLAIYLLFTRLLDITLPLGVLERLMG